ncbi:hypothetical protein ZIOFF_071417 [Zingiber officinale]|nr:hypothetical protein ZIOFF_071417 [Zingiber officinale]
MGLLPDSTRDEPLRHPLLFGIKRKSFVFTKTVLGSHSFWRNFRLGFICLGDWQFILAPTVDLQKQRFQSDLDKL